MKVRTTPLGALVRGLLAGTAGTLAFDTVWYLRYRKAGGTDSFYDWEFSSSVKTWDEAAAPAQVGRRVWEGLFQTKLPDDKAALVNNIMHWAYGVGSAAPYGLLAGSLSNPRILYGPPFGAGVWGAGYVILPAAGLYKPITEYPRDVLAKDLSAHLVYGVVTAVVFKLLSLGRGRRG
nr:hypothetical protein [uncultured Actinoplanes sp.]